MKIRIILYGGGAEPRSCGASEPRARPEPDWVALLLHSLLTGSAKNERTTQETYQRQSRMTDSSEGEANVRTADDFGEAERRGGGRASTHAS